MTLACVGLVIPAAYHAGRRDGNFDDFAVAKAAGLVDAGNANWVDVLLQQDALGTDDDAAKGVLIISRGTAIVRPLPLAPACFTPC